MILYPIFIALRTLKAAEARSKSIDLRPAEGAEGDQSYSIFPKSEPFESLLSVYSIVMVFYSDIGRGFFGYVPTSTTLLGRNRYKTRVKCHDFSVFAEIIEGLLELLTNY